MRGVDVSHNNTGVDFSTLRKNGIDFAMIRAGRGTAADNKFKTHMQSASDAGMLIGIYWFAYPFTVSDAVKEADKCAETIAGYKIDLPVFYDFEYNTEDYAKKNGVVYNKKLRTDIVCAFCDRIAVKGYKPGVYANIDYLRYRFDAARLKKYPLWFAYYVNRDGTASFDKTAPNGIPSAYANAMIWQFGMCKMPGGGAGNIDINYGYNMPAANKTPEDNAAKYTVGQKYTIKRGDIYTNGNPVPSRLIGKVYTIMQTKPGAILLREIMSWVKV